MFSGPQSARSAPRAVDGLADGVGVCGAEIPDLIECAVGSWVAVPAVDGPVACLDAGDDFGGELFGWSEVVWVGDSRMLLAAASAARFTGLSILDAGDGWFGLYGHFVRGLYAGVPLRGPPRSQTTRYRLRWRGFLWGISRSRSIAGALRESR